MTALVLAGTKTATAGLLDEDYVEEGEALEHVGERLVLVGDDGAAAAVVEVTAVAVLPFAQVTDRFARAEGEGYAGHEDWAADHRAYWQRHGRAVTAETAVVCLEFVVAAAPLPAGN